MSSVGPDALKRQPTFLPSVHMHNRFDSTSTSAAAFPPNLVTSSFTPLQSSPRRRHHSDLSALRREIISLEQTLQGLLNVQTHRLMTGSGLESSHGYDFEPREASNSATHCLAGEGPVVSSLTKTPTLWAARRGIYSCMQLLVAAKADEALILNRSLASIDNITQKLEAWARKQTCLEEKIQAITTGDAAARIRALQGEAAALDRDIKLAEQRIRHMKRRHATIMKETSEAQHSVNSRLSSYRTSLSLLVSEAAEFFIEQPISDNSCSGRPLFILQPSYRHHLVTDQEHWQQQHMELAGQFEEVKYDAAALEEGATLWLEVVTRVTEFERCVEQSTQSGHAFGPFQLSERTMRVQENSTQGLLRKMDTAIEYLKEKYDVASSRSWKLLVCCIGAELAAFTQGKALLEGNMVPTCGRNEAECKDDIQPKVVERACPETENTSAALDINPELLLAGT